MPSDARIAQNGLEFKTPVSLPPLLLAASVGANYISTTLEFMHKRVIFIYT